MHQEQSSCAAAPETRYNAPGWPIGARHARGPEKSRRSLGTKIRFGPLSRAKYVYVLPCLHSPSRRTQRRPVLLTRHWPFFVSYPGPVVRVASSAIGLKPTARDCLGSPLRGLSAVIGVGFQPVPSAEEVPSHWGQFVFSLRPEYTLVNPVIIIEGSLLINALSTSQTH